MNILHINVNFNKSFFIDLFTQIGKSGFKQIIFYPSRKRNKLEVDQLPDIEIVHDPCLSIFTRIFFFLKSLKIFYKIRFKTNLKDIDIIHAHTIFSDGAPAFLLRKKYGIPYIVSIRNTDINIFLRYKPWLSYAGRLILRNSEQIISISEALKKSIISRYGNESGIIEKIIVIPNGIQNIFFENNVKTSVKVMHTPLSFIYVGSFWKLKNIENIIKFIKGNPDYRLEIVGSGGDNEKKILQLIKANDITYHGQINDPNQLIQILQKNDIFIMPSKIETFGIVYIEAMSQGLPVLYSKNTGIDGMFEEGLIGYAVDPLKPSEWNNAIKKIVDNFNSISNTCVIKSKEFNWNRIADHYIDIYKRVKSI